MYVVGSCLIFLLFQAGCSLQRALFPNYIGSWRLHEAFDKTGLPLKKRDNWPHQIIIRFNDNNIINVNTFCSSTAFTVQKIHDSFAVRPKLPIRIKELGCDKTELAVINAFTGLAKIYLANGSLIWNKADGKYFYFDKITNY